MQQLNGSLAADETPIPSTAPVVIQELMCFPPRVSLFSSEDFLEHMLHDVLQLKVLEVLPTRRWEERVALGRCTVLQSRPKLQRLGHTAPVPHKDTKQRYSLGITMHLTAVVLILVVAGIAKGWDCRGCNTENGFCEKPGKCRCKPGWQGDNCDRCLLFPGCLHGTCERAWQCVCAEGWVGSLCDQDTRLCSSRPCVGNATCIETGEGGYLCICPPGYAGESCHLKTGACLTNGYQRL
ncbi:unnamed protein product [Pleuronectes platessa]|uniref:EGF-like domain-containing protein n=1 Tax=Pleuronectes platessa TaxID=8262 RepID=A0A9N7YP78_PLEPL|nr:unnamed protein product [Pleuronectes platessa]